MFIDQIETVILKLKAFLPEQMGCLYRKQPVFFVWLLVSCMLHALVFRYVDIGGDAVSGSQAATLKVRFLKHGRAQNQLVSVITGKVAENRQMATRLPIEEEQAAPVQKQSESITGDGGMSLPVYSLSELDNAAIVRQNFMLDPPDLSSFNQGGDIKIKVLVNEAGSVANTEMQASTLGSQDMEQQILAYLQTLHLEPGRVLQKPARYYVIINLHYDAVPGKGNASSASGLGQSLRQVP